jgi:hypothetical protein
MQVEQLGLELLLGERGRRGGGEPSTLLAASVAIARVAVTRATEENRRTARGADSHRPSSYP